MRTLTLALFTTSLLALPACNGGGGGESSTAATDETSGTTNTGVDPTTTSNGTSTTAPDDTTMGSATGGTGTNPTTTGEPVTSTTLEPETSTTLEPATSTTLEPGTSTTLEPETSTTLEPGTGTGTGTTGDPGACADLGPMECMANEACMPIGGGKLNLQKMCVGKPMFLACEPAAGCGDALTYGCDAAVEPPEPFLFPSTCLPAGWVECEAPPIDKPCK